MLSDDVGGRFSVLTAVGLLPIAVAGCDIDALMKGAAKAQADFCADFDDNDCYKYAALRNILYRKGKSLKFKNDIWNSALCMSKNSALKSFSVNNRHILICKEIKSIKVFSICFQEQICFRILYINNGLKHDTCAVLYVLTHRMKVCRESNSSWENTLIVLALALSEKLFIPF